MAIEHHIRPFFFQEIKKENRNRWAVFDMLSVWLNLFLLTEAIFHPDNRFFYCVFLQSLAFLWKRIYGISLMCAIVVYSSNFVFKKEGASVSHSFDFEADTWRLQSSVYKSHSLCGRQIGQKSSAPICVTAYVGHSAGQVSLIRKNNMHCACRSNVMATFVQFVIIITGIPVAISSKHHS